MDDPYDVVIHPRLLARLARKAYESGLAPGSLSAKEIRAARWALEVLRQGREEFLDGERLGRSDNHVDLRDCAEIKIPVVQEYTARGRPLGPCHRVIYREYALADSGRPVREVIAFAPRADRLPLKLAGDDHDRPIGIELDDLEGVKNTRPAVGRGKDPERPTVPVLTTPSPDVAAAIATRLSPPPCGPVFADRARSPLAVQAVSARPLLPPPAIRYQAGQSWTHRIPRSQHSMALAVSVAFSPEYSHSIERMSISCGAGISWPWDRSIVTRSLLF